MSRIEKILKGIAVQEWTFAKSMADIPHWYTVRKRWADDSAFTDFVQFIRDFGYEEKFYKKTFKYLNLNGYKYWTMGEAINQSDGSPWTIIINRAKINYNGNYDKVAETYDENYTDDKFLEQDKVVMNSINPCGRVFDVGCGTGLFLKHNKDYCFKEYVGIDPSQGMLDVLCSRYSSDKIKAINSTVSDYYDYQQFDSVYSLFGSASYLTLAELIRLERYLKEGGDMLLMFLTEGYKTVYHDEINDSINIALNDSHGPKWEHYIMITQKELPNLIETLKKK